MTSDLAYAFVMSEIQRLMNKFGLVDTKMGKNAVLLRKYIKPAKRTEKTEDSAESRVSKKAKKVELLIPQHQVVFLNMNSFE